MTAKEAIDYLLDPIGKREKHDEAIRMAVEALNHSADDSKKVSSSCGQENDLIEREAVIDDIDEWIEIYGADKCVDAQDILKQVKRSIKKLPYVQPKPEQNTPSEQGESDKLGVKMGKTCTDTISRQAAIDALEEYLEEYDGLDERGLHSEKWCAMSEAKMAIEALPSAQPAQHGRIFQEIVVEYPSISAYPEHEGKPYFSIKYEEDGQGYIGYGTYKPKVLSQYLKEYFMPSAQPELIEQGAYVRGFGQGRTQGMIDAQGAKDE